jgi:hypothetical protein
MPKTGPIKRRSLSESLSAYAESKAKKKSARLERRLARKKKNEATQGEDR